MRKCVNLSSATPEQKIAIAKIMGVDEIPEGAELLSAGSFSLTVSIPEKPVYISDLISHLQDVMARSGDLPVAVNNDYGTPFGLKLATPAAAVVKNMVRKESGENIYWELPQKASPKSKAPPPKKESIFVINFDSDSSDDED